MSIIGYFEVPPLKEPTDHAVVVKTVTRTFPSGGEAVDALSDASIVVASGETMAITGPSGSGKTTLVNLIASHDRPTSGTVTIFGQVWGPKITSHATGASPGLIA